MYRFKSNGDWRKTFEFLNRNRNVTTRIDQILRSAAERGVEELIRNTPIDTGLAASSWGYFITKDKESFKITWTNNDIEGGYNVAILVQYGHGTGTGGYVVGRDFINPAMQPIFQNIADDIWKEVTR